MQIPDTDSNLLHVIRQILGHALGKRGDQHFCFLLYFLIDLLDQIVNLSFYRTYFHSWIQKAGGPYELFRTQKLVIRLVFPGVADTKSTWSSFCSNS